MRAKPYHPVVLDLLQSDNARRILDAPCGQGWLGDALLAGSALADGASSSPPTVIGSHTHAARADGPSAHASRVLDGIGLYEFPAPGNRYRSVVEHDLNYPLLNHSERYDTVVCAEAIHLLTCPGTMLESFIAALKPGGRVIITTPNNWAPNSRLRFLRRGFHAGFNTSIDKQVGADYITYFPFSFDQLHRLLRHYRFEDITLHPVAEPKPVTLLHRMLSAGSRRYCRKQAARAASSDIRRYWLDAGSDAAQHGRWLVMSAKTPTTMG